MNKEEIVGRLEKVIEEIKEYADDINIINIDICLEEGISNIRVGWNPLYIKK